MYNAYNCVVFVQELSLQYIERHVDFAGLDLDADALEKEVKLRRRDTPHHLKNKRITLGSPDPDHAEEKVRAILAQAAQQRHSTDEASTPTGSEEVSRRAPPTPPPLSPCPSVRPSVLGCL